MRQIVKHTCDGNGPFPCDDRCYEWVEDDPQIVSVFAEPLAQLRRDLQDMPFPTTEGEIERDARITAALDLIEQRAAELQAQAETAERLRDEISATRRGVGIAQNSLRDERYTDADHELTNALAIAGKISSGRMNPWAERDAAEQRATELEAENERLRSGIQVRDNIIADATLSAREEAQWPPASPPNLADTVREKKCLCPKCSAPAVYEGYCMKCLGKCDRYRARAALDGTRQ